MKKKKKLTARKKTKKRKKEKINPKICAQKRAIFPEASHYYTLPIMQ